MNDFTTFHGLIINAVTLGVPFIKLAFDFHKSNKIKQEQLNRNAFKVKIFEVLLNGSYNYPNLVNVLQGINPLQPVNQTELKMCLYEMMVEDTIGYSDSSQDYFANTE